MLTLVVGLLLSLVMQLGWYNIWGLGIGKKTLKTAVYNIFSGKIWGQAQEAKERRPNVQSVISRMGL